MFVPEREHLVDVMLEKGYECDCAAPYRLVIVGIRASREATNKFDDSMCVLYNDGDGYRLNVWPCTTDPGTWYLKNGLEKGTAVLVPGQYRDAYRRGLHKGQYTALVQSAPVVVYRDSTKDGILDYIHPEKGLFGINIHRASQTATSVLVDKWSAGCQVFASADHFNAFMALTKKAAELHGNSFSYTLLELKDFGAGIVR